MKATTATSAIKGLLEENGISKAAYARMLGITSAAAWDRLNNDNISVKKLTEMLGVLDYAIVIQPKSKKLVDGAVAIK